MNSTIFTVEPDHLGRLGPKEAVHAISALLWLEATRIGVPIAGVNISDNVDVPDGGVDADVTAAVPIEDLIRAGKTGYQIKTLSGIVTLLDPTRTRSSFSNGAQL